jgi:hypothetical protein
VATGKLLYFPSYSKVYLTEVDWLTKFSKLYLYYLIKVLYYVFK